MKKTPYKLLKFQNGLNLILKSIPSVNSAVVYVAVGAGPRYETKKTAGLAHFLEHMLFEGTKRLPSSKKVAEYIEKVGGRSCAWTDKEYVTTKKKLQDYMTRFYHPSNMAIAVAGNFSIEAAEKYALKYFGKGQKKDIPQFEKQKFVPKKIHTQIIEANTNQIYHITIKTVSP